MAKQSRAPQAVLLGWHSRALRLASAGRYRGWHSCACSLQPMGDWMTDRLRRERAILRLVYDEGEFVSVEPQDVPDIVLRHPGSTASFGVEVTELYQTESDARITRHPRYVSELLAGGVHMHRDDIAILDVASVSIRDKDGVLKQSDVPAIVRQLPSHADHAAALASTIRRKSLRVGDYEVGLSHVNLIVHDRFDMPFGPDSEYAVGEVVTRELRLALMETQFREVFLVSSTRNGQLIYRPLRMLLLLESFYLFLGALVSFEERPAEIGPDDLAPLFVHAMQASEMTVGLAGDPGDHQYAFYGGAGIRHEAGQISILDFADHPLPAPAELPSNPYPAAVWRAFVEHHRLFVDSNAFICELALPVKSDSD